MISAEELKIHVVSEDVLDGFPEESITALIKRKTISEWGSNVRTTSTTIQACFLAIFLQITPTQSWRIIELLAKLLEFFDNILEFFIKILEFFHQNP